MFHLLDIIGNDCICYVRCLTAISKKKDPFGVYNCFVTAVGGGTLRDVMIGRTPRVDARFEYVYVIALAFVLSILFRRKFDNHCFI
jgi:uncharacterized membrane protein YeiH